MRAAVLLARELQFRFPDADARPERILDLVGTLILYPTLNQEPLSGGQR